ncbi:MAG: sulfite exporter TauE/SafE family protein [Phycisphaerales bacterium]|nr:sulfite exporter TauE/SafE family protein [Phycisphaerales bacterium]
MNWLEILGLIVLGLTAGGLGGLLGIGGSVIMIPALMLLLDKNQHLAAAAAMIINAAIAFPAMYRHSRAKAVRWDVVIRMLPAAIICIVLGVELSNTVDAALLRRLFGVFLLYVIAMNVIRMVQSTGEPDVEAQRTSWPVCSVTGGLIGFVAGLLGIGGGAIGVPLIQRICNLPLRQCIASMSALMGVTATVGAVMKNVTLDRVATASGETLHWMDSVEIAAVLLPTAVLGGLLGATLTHILPLKYVRFAFLVLITIAAMRMLGLDQALWSLLPSSGT